MADGLRRALYAQLYDLVDLVELQGILERDFVRSYNLTYPRAKGFLHFMEQLAQFCSECESALTYMGYALDYPTVHYNELLQCAVMMKEPVTCFGARALALTLDKLGVAIYAGVRDECFTLANRLRQEYADLRMHLEKIVELDRRILSIEQDQTAANSSSSNNAISDKDIETDADNDTDNNANNNADN